MADSDDECSSEQASSPSYWISKIEKGKRSAMGDKPATYGVYGPIEKPTKTRKILDTLYFGMKCAWGDDYVISSCFSLLLDPLFLYIIIINDDSKCLMFDETLKKIALVLRVVLVDLPSVPKTVKRLLVDLPRRLKYTWKGRGPFVESSVLGSDDKRRRSVFKECAEIIWESNIAIGTLFVLPIPQLVILVFFPTMRGSTSLNTMKILNLLIALSYVTRVLPIWRFCKRLNKLKLDPKLRRRDPKLWVPAVVNFILYILASHVLGAFWYFFSLQRQIDCWGYACESENRCEYSYFDCDHSTFKNITLLNDLCPINPPNTEVFDFGIFLGALQSGILGSTDFSQKFLQCFSWGLRNLSSFASNLNTSTYAWEALFVIFISICGLFLFIYLLGYLQTFMQATDKSKRFWLKMDIIYPKIESMLSEYGLSHLKYVIYTMVRKELEDREDLVVDNVFSILPLELKRYIKRRLFLRTLESLAPSADQQLLKTICESLEPVMYTEGSYIIQQGEPLDMMLFITQGIVMTYTPNNNIINGGMSTAASLSTISLLKKDDSYGEGLLSWACEEQSENDCVSRLPISGRTLKAHTKVEVFAIRACELQKIVSESKKPPHSTDQIDHTQRRSSTDRIELAHGNDV